VACNRSDPKPTGRPRRDRFTKQSFSVRRRSQEQVKISEKEYLADYARRRALVSGSKIRLTMTLALPQLVQRSRLTKEAIGAVELTPKRASAASSKMPS
jgi:hypothetical protein